ncbi:MAG: cyclic pyranopterin monophosphate synthase MoaC [Planctomycetia bacterium]|nr:cyclic pyranopterin monophosphate synthase MoaC [Planctomycetia bacterium]MCC7314623.1 cyclic pyranopterin monophosphate synthase MoaC [Planctomycetota bacterium]
MTSRLSIALSHVDARGRARMVDVSAKKVTRRRAVASAQVKLRPATLKLIHDGKIPKGDVFAVARLAGIQAAKETSRLIPLCHPLPLDHVELEISAKRPDRVIIRAEAAVGGKTGVEMEALVAASVAAMTIYDMCKAVDRGIEIGPIRLEEKSGGRSGTWKRTGKNKKA